MAAFDMTGKTVIVTGSTSGIGIGIAKCFAEAGASVVITGRRANRGQEVVDEIVAAGGKATFHALDITSEESIKALIEDTVAEQGKLDVLINNAASTDAENGNVADVSSEAWDHMFQTDLKSVFLACKYAIPHMIENGGGAICSTGSSAGVLSQDGWSAYGPAKGAVETLMNYIACQYGKQNIRANTVHPGLIVTPQNEAGIPQFFKDIYVDTIEVNRYGCPRDIGYAMLFLCSDEASFVTSQALCVDGGQMSHAPQVSALRHAFAEMSAQAE